MAKPPIAVGLDFGMTNSLLTYYDVKKGPVPLYAKSGGDFRIPSVIGKLSALAEQWLFGKFARKKAAILIEHFKVLLPRLPDDPSARENSRDFQAAARFLCSVFEDFASDSGHTRCDHLVVTVPESWICGTELSGLDALRQIFEDLSVSNSPPRFLSEPVAAACHFAYSHKEKLGLPFNGHVLVYDHGGSTMDISVVRVEGDHIGVVSSFGRGRDISETGFGGVYFDERVLVRVSAREGNEHLVGLSIRDRADWLSEFEENKRDHVDLIRDRSRDGRAENRYSEIFSVDDTQILLDDLLGTFESDFADRIRTDLERVVDLARRDDSISTNDPKRFRVVAVGGFAEFYPLQQLLRSFSTNYCGTGEVLDQSLTRNERWLAVASGACLVAAGNVHVAETCPFTFGVVTFQDADVDKPLYNELMVRESPIASYSGGVYLKKKFEVEEHATAGHDSIVFYMERGGNNKHLTMQRRFIDHLPDYGEAKSWEFGCAVEEGSVIVFVRSNMNHTTSIRMGNIMRMLDYKFDEPYVVK